MVGCPAPFPLHCKHRCQNPTLSKEGSNAKLVYSSLFPSALSKPDISENIQHFNGALRTINQVFTTTKTQKHTRLKAYKVLARPVLMYGSEAWPVRNSDVQRLTTAEMRFLRRTAGYSLLDHKRNELITKELKITPIYEHLNHYRQKWLNHVNRMDRSRLPTQILRYIPHGRRSLGRPLKRWTETVVVITEDVQNVHLLLEYRPHIDVSLTCEHDPKLQDYCECPQNIPQFDSEGIPNQAPETNKPMILNGPTSRNREGSDQAYEVIVLYGCESSTLTLREERRLRVFENKVLRKIFVAKRDEITGERRKLHNAELHALYSSPDIIRNIKSRRLRWAGHVARMGESRNAYRVLVGRPEGKRPLWRPRRRWEDNIKMYVFEGVSAIRPVLHSPGLPIPTPPDDITLTEVIQSVPDVQTELQNDPDFVEDDTINEPNFLTQEDLNDLVRDLGLSKSMSRITRLKIERLEAAAGNIKCSSVARLNTLYRFMTFYTITLTIPSCPLVPTLHSCHNPDDLRNYAVKLTGFLEFGKDAATLPPRGFDGHLSILLNEGCDWLLNKEDKISVTVRKTFIYDNQLVREGQGPMAGLYESGNEPADSLKVIGNSFKTEDLRRRSSHLASTSRTNCTFKRIDRNVEVLCVSRDNG
ncbi:hypothetical protein ANN_12354 [Periplaneta americana]|uniref:Uncharacterized protein n=1 Tax=Periplaneta americana TaxID=6978 RepID=A0ABQ8TIJ8_PERAM|nr:hypothetical protein ANN_12354 [Periplaneta americana]